MTSTLLATADRLDIESLLTEYGWRLDHGGDIGQLFTADAMLVAPGVGLQLSGREAIARHFSGGPHPSGRVTRHLWLGLRINEVNDGAVRFNTVQLTYLRLPGELPSARHVMVGDTCDRVARERDGSWRFVERRLEVIFPFDVPIPGSSQEQK